MLVQRQIQLTIQLGNNPQSNQPVTFAESGGNALTITGASTPSTVQQNQGQVTGALRMSVKIYNSGNPDTCTAEIKVWGLTPSVMNQLATLGLIANQLPNNTITVQAGNAGQNLTTVFQGGIIGAYTDYEGQPDVPFTMTAKIGAFFKATLAPPTSFTGPFDVATAMSGFARQMSMKFINNGISKQMPRGGYYTGAVWDQARKLAADAHIAYGSPDGGGTLQIWPLNSPRSGQTPVTISPSMPDGSISYPAFTQSGIIVKTVFNPSVTLGCQVNVVSTVLSSLASIQSQRGLSYPSNWTVVKLDMFLDTMVPHGQWMMVIYCYSASVAQSVQPPT